jgi:excisionase family DNA binding protein
VKATWKLRSLGGEAADVVASSPTVSAAARRLGVSRDTVHAWIRAGKVAQPAGRRTERPPRARTVGTGQYRTFEAWALATYDFTRAEREIVKLAQNAANIARSKKSTASEQLQASALFVRLVRELRLPAEGEADGDAEETNAPVQFPRKVS